MSENALQKSYGSIKILRIEHEWDDPVRKGAIRAYIYTKGTIFIVAVVLAALHGYPLALHAKYRYFLFTGHLLC